MITKGLKKTGQSSFLLVIFIQFAKYQFIVFSDFFLF